MFHPIADSLDPKVLRGFLHPSGYPGSSYFDVVSRLAVAYAVPLLLVVLLAFAAVLIAKRPARVSWWVLSVVLVPAVVWVALVYADASGKAIGNLLELVLLGVFAGGVVVLSGRSLGSLRNALRWGAALAGVAFALWLFV